ncbi:MAG: hypothetical protein CMO46_08490 [Verrucomicrobiales bacterium]|mgnify:FL=1|nr:hypothetical protein [Verrucomicrobiales bacterium]
MKKNYHIIVLAVVIAFGAFLGWMCISGTAEEFNSDINLKQNKNFGDATASSIQNSIDHLSRDVKWITPTLDGVPEKPLPLTRSIPIWVKNDEEIDLLDPSSPQISPPLANSWAFKYGVDVGRSDLLSLDEDNDGFTTEEEFLGGKTDPGDEKSHPPYTSKMVLSEIKEDTYALIFRTGDNPDGEFGVREEATRYEAEPARVPPRRKSHFLKMNAVFGTHPSHEDRYQIKAFEKKTKPGGAGGIPTPAHLLTVSDKKSGSDFQLEYKVPKVEKTFFAVIDFQLPGSESQIGPLKVGESFELPVEPGVKYEVVNLEGTLENGVKLRKTGAEGASPEDITISAGK